MKFGDLGSGWGLGRLRMGRVVSAREKNFIFFVPAFTYRSLSHFPVPSYPSHLSSLTASPLAKYVCVAVFRSNLRPHPRLFAVYEAVGGPSLGLFRGGGGRQEISEVVVDWRDEFPSPQCGNIIIFT